MKAHYTPISGTDAFKFHVELEGEMAELLHTWPDLMFQLPFREGWRVISVPGYGGAVWWNDNKWVGFGRFKDDKWVGILVTKPEAVRPDADKVVEELELIIEQFVKNVRRSGNAIKLAHAIGVQNYRSGRMRHGISLASGD